MNNMRSIQEITERELKMKIEGGASWHNQYKDSAYVYIGGLDYELTEGDIIAVFSQYGEVININLVRNKKTGKSKGFCFLCYEDQRSTILAVDNFNGIKVVDLLFIVYVYCLLFVVVVIQYFVYTEYY
jgi:RNA-binding motif X-linked protein 2